MQRLLVIKLSSLGDVAQALPVATALRRRFPDARLSWAVEGRCSALLEGHAAIDRVIPFPPLAWGGVRRGWLAELRRALTAVREETYDAVLDLQGLVKSSLIALAARAPQRLGVAPQREGAALVSTAVALPAGRVHAVERYLHVAAHLGAAMRPVHFGLSAADGAARSLSRTLRERGVAPADPLIVVAPSAAQARKMWPAERWVAVADALADCGRVLLTGSAEQCRRHREIAARMRSRPVDLTGATSLAELIALVDRCAVLLAPDSGALHLAAALGRPVVGVYGPTPPWRLGPYGQLDAAVHHADACGVGCPRICTRGRQCLRAVSAEEVIARAQAALAQAAPASQRDHSVG